MKNLVLSTCTALLVGAAMMPGRASSHREAPLIAHRSGGGQHRCLRVRRSERAGHGHAHHQLHSAAAPRCRAQLLCLRSQRASTRSTSTTTATRSRTSPSSGGSRPSTATRRRSSTQHRSGHLARRPGPELPPVLQPDPRRRPAPHRHRRRCALGRLPVPPQQHRPAHHAQLRAPRRRRAAGALRRHARLRRPARRGLLRRPRACSTCSASARARSRTAPSGLNVSTLAHPGADSRSSPAAARRSQRPDDPNAVIGVWSTASRQATATRTAGRIALRRRLRAGLAPRQPAGERSGDRPRAQGRLQLARADRRRRGARSRASIPSWRGC